MFQGDASDTSDMERVIASTVEHFGRIDILVNNANPGQRDPSASARLSGHLRGSAVPGLLPAVQSCVREHAAGRAADDRSRASRRPVITITSVHQERPWGSDSIYGPMKAALRRLVMSQARELAPHGIRVNAIAPGFIDNRLFEGERGERYDEYNVRAETEILLGPGKPVRHRRRGRVPGVRRCPLRHRHLPAGRRRHAAAADHRNLVSYNSEIARGRLDRHASCASGGKGEYGAYRRAARAE